jgi:hypothetical protein
VQGNGDGHTASLSVTTDGDVIMFGVTSPGSSDYALDGVTFRP